MLTDYKKHTIIIRLEDTEKVESSFFLEVFTLGDKLGNPSRSAFLFKQNIRSLVKGSKPKERNYPAIFAVHEEFRLDGVALQVTGDALTIYLYIHKTVGIQEVLAAINEPYSIYTGVNYSRISDTSSV